MNTQRVLAGVDLKVHHCAKYWRNREHFVRMDPFEDEEPPPPYSPGPDPDVVCHDHHAPDAGQTFDCIEKNIANAKHCHEIRRHGHDKFTIERTSGTPSSIGARIEGQTLASDGTSYTILYTNSRRVGTARFVKHRGDCVELHLGPAYNPPSTQWKPMKLSRNGLLHSASYEFESGSKHLAWRHCHGPHVLGGAGDWILEDLSAVGSIAPAHRREGARWVQKVIVGGHTMAVFHARPGSWIHGRSPEYVVGQVKWGDEYGEEVELTALLTLAAILQQS